MAGVCAGVLAGATFCNSFSAALRMSVSAPGLGGVAGVAALVFSVAGLGVVALGAGVAFAGGVTAGAAVLAAAGFAY